MIGFFAFLAVLSACIAAVSIHRAAAVREGRERWHRLVTRAPDPSHVRPIWPGETPPLLAYNWQADKRSGLAVPPPVAQPAQHAAA